MSVAYHYTLYVLFLLLQIYPHNSCLASERYWVQHSARFLPRQRDFNRLS